jgi:hypothetical protein
LDGWISWNAFPLEDGRPYSGSITERRAFRSPAGDGYEASSSSSIIWDIDNGDIDAT